MDETLRIGEQPSCLFVHLEDELFAELFGVQVVDIGSGGDEGVSGCRVVHVNQIVFLIVLVNY